MMDYNRAIVLVWVTAVVGSLIIAIALLSQSSNSPSVELIQPIHVDVDSQVLALSVLLAIADGNEATCEEDEYYWFTGDFDGRQWVRRCIPVDMLFVQ